ncbi:hypothetical protein BG004_005255 [Podila humilis]|nr:hypothetical protein BG004_005255 [Podila humilis]
MSKLAASPHAGSPSPSLSYPKRDTKQKHTQLPSHTGHSTLMQQSEAGLRKEPQQVDGEEVIGESEFRDITEEWPIESQKVKDEQIQAFYREYAMRITAALTQYANQDREIPSGVPEDVMEKGREYAYSPSPEKLLELYATLLRDNKDSYIREALTGNSNTSSSLRRSLAAQQPCECGSSHANPGPLNAPDSDFDEELDNMEDEDDEDDDDDDYDDGDDDDEDYDDEDDDYDDVDDDEEEDEYEGDSNEMYDVEDKEDDILDHGIEGELESEGIDGFAHRYDIIDPQLLAKEEELRRLEIIRKVREEEGRLREILKAKQHLEKQRIKEEQERLNQLGRKRIEEEARQKREREEALAREQELEEELRKRQLAEDDQNARSYMFLCASESNLEVVKKIVETTPQDSVSDHSILPFSSASVTRLSGWEYMLYVDGPGDSDSDLENGFTETLLHIATRNDSMELVSYLIDKGAPLDAIDFSGHTPLHVAAKCSSALPICKLLIEKTMPHIDRTTITTAKTALHYAAVRGYPELVELLLSNQAKINITDMSGKTPEAYAKIGLELAMREKTLKKVPKNAANAKIQRYRATLQHLHKAMATIREAQTRKDAQLEERRRRDEALARDEEEKDMAARRKQEEKLVADMRRQQEQEKELERLKALAATNPNGQSSGGSGGKKKKKKKGKSAGGDLQPQQPQSQNPHSAPGASAPSPPPSLPSLSPSLSVGSPAVMHSSQATLSKAASAPTTVAAPSTSASHKSNFKHGSASTSSVLSTLANTNTAPTPAVASTLKPLSETLKPPRLPKVKTTYRPSPLVVSRMEDMGFPCRVSRKALIMTEGKVEEAIDILTTGAALADDSEDEAEKKAEASRLKAAKKVTAVAPAASKHASTSEHGITKTTAKAPHLESSGSGPLGLLLPFMTNESTTNVTASSTAASVLRDTGVSKTPPSVAMQSSVLSPVSARSSQKSSAKSNSSSLSVQNNANAYRNVGRPVQILQRTHPMAAHVQMRSVPTQVLQHAQPSGASGVTRRSFSSEGQSEALPQPLPAKVQAPFVPSPLIHHIPPTRAPYSYGAKPQALEPLSGSTVHDRSQPLSQSNPSSIPQSTVQMHTDNAIAMRAAHVLSNDTVDGALRTGEFSAMSPYLAGTQNLGYQGYTEEATNRNMGGSMSSASVPLTNMGMDSSYAMPGTNNLWATSQLPADLGLIIGNTSIGGLSSPFANSFTGMSPLARLSAFRSSRGPGGISTKSPGYHATESEQPDVDIIKDVVAMTGAIDSDDFEDELDNDYLLRNPNSGDIFSSSAPSRAVGGGRAQSHAASSLWSGDAFGGLISPVKQYFSNSGDGFFHERRSTPMNVSTYSQWDSGVPSEQKMIGTNTYPQRSSFVDSFFGLTDEDQGAEHTTSGSFINVSNPSSSSADVPRSSTGKQTLLNLISSPLATNVPSQRGQQQQSPSTLRLSPSERYTRLNNGGSQSYFDV